MKQATKKTTIIDTVKTDLINRIKNGENILNLDTSSYSVGLAVLHGFKPTTVERCLRRCKADKTLSALYGQVNQ